MEQGNIKDALLQYTDNLDKVMGAKISQIVGDSYSEKDILLALSSVCTQMPNLHSWILKALYLLRKTPHVEQLSHAVAKNVPWYRDLQNQVALTGPAFPSVAPKKPLVLQGITITNAPDFFNNFRTLNACYTEYIVKDPCPFLLKEITFYDDLATGETS